MTTVFKVQSKFCVKKTRLNFFLIDKHNETIYGGVRIACSSSRVLLPCYLFCSGNLHPDYIKTKWPQWSEPGFPRGGSQPQIGDILFGITSAKNCMKMEKKWTEGWGVRPSCPLPKCTTVSLCNYHLLAYY